MISTARIATQHGAAYTRRLCKHFAHKIPAYAADGQGRIDFPFGVCTIDSDDSFMYIRVDLTVESDADRAERVIADHLVRMANKDQPKVSWRRL